MRRTLLAALLPAGVITVAWLRLEDPKRMAEGALVAGLALAPALGRSRRTRLGAVVASGLCVAWIAFGAQPWELAPFRDEHVLSPLLQDAARGIVDFYEVLVPFQPRSSPEMHSLVLTAIFGFVIAMALFVAARRPLAAAAVTVAGVGWPTTLLGGKAIGVGALALAAALAIPLLLRASSARALAAGIAVAALVVAAAASASATTTLGSSSALNWETWDLGGPQKQATAVRFVWNSNYKGISFPATRTIVLRVDGPTAPHYWRTTTLDEFARDHWFESLYWLSQVDHASRTLPLPELTPERARSPTTWVEQRVRIEALVDEHLPATGTPVALDADRIGTIFQLSGGVLRGGPIRVGDTYRVWSYAPDPAPRSLATAPARYPLAARRFLIADGRILPPFAARHREQLMRRLFDDPSYSAFRRYLPLYAAARRVAGDAKTPYAAVLALESWFRQTGGFTYDESPPRVEGSPLVAFVTRTKTGYCQHFAGAMAVMLRMLGVPARVAVGFVNGQNHDGTWIVTDHDAHAWVEVWFAGPGWIPFDPTPGRGTLGGSYSFASGSDAATAALRRGQLGRSSAAGGRTRAPDVSDLEGISSTSGGRRAPSLVAVGFVLVALWVAGLGLAKAIMRRLRYLSSDPRKLATASRRELEDFLRDQGVEVPVTATLATLQRAVSSELGLDGRPFARAAARARFGRPDSTQAAAARREVRALIHAARHELSVWARLRGLVSLRSLRAAGTP